MIIECVPNFSEGREASTIAAIAQAAKMAPGAFLLDVTSDVDHNRTVLTIAGPPDATAEAVFLAVTAGAERIDMRRHTGVHPRLGAADVIPFVPVQGITLDQCAILAREVGQRIWEELRIPVFLYEAAALRPECSRLENVRRLARAGLQPDFGEAPHPAGVSVVGARDYLVAWNINLRTTDLAAARIIAREIRESGGGLPAVKAIGLPLASRGQVQVSINLIDFRRTPPHLVFDAVARRCSELGIEIAGSELIGMIPEAALAASKGHDLKWLNLRPELVLENRLRELKLL